MVPLFILWFLSYPILLLQKWITNGKFVCIFLHSLLSNILRTLNIVKENEKKLGKHLPSDLSETSVQWFSKQNAQTSTINNTWDPVSRMYPEVHWGTVVNSQGHLRIPQNFKGLPATLDTCQTLRELLVQGGRQFWHELNSPFYNAVSLWRQVFNIRCDKKAKAVLKTNVE